MRGRARSVSSGLRMAEGPRGFAGTKRTDRWPPTKGRPRPDVLARSLDTLPGVGPALRGELVKLGLRTIRDLLEHRPRDYQQAVGETAISDLFGDEEAVIAGEVRRVSVRPTRRRLTVLKAAVRDSSGEISAVWFNQPWLADKLQPGTKLRLRGQLRRNDFHVRSDDVDGASATADFAPVYPASEEVTSPRLRALVETALPHARDFGDSLPEWLRARERLPLRFDALVALHRPRGAEEAERARRRLALDELLLLQVGLARIREGTEEATAPPLGEPGELVERYREALPFELTADQERAISEIDADLAGTKPMQRLLQGDVGSGKTVVALYALLRAVEAGRTGALMAPTETLAEQHFLKLEPICAQIGVRAAFLTGSVKGELEGAQIVVGTHALIQEGVDLSDLAVAVVDEQHRFGVEQRGALVAGRSPHVLHMTATPIPRTLALTVYGDLAVTEISKPPANRKPIVTSWVTEERSAEAYRRLRKRRDDGDRGRRRCSERDDHDRPGGRPVRPGPAAPAARPSRPRRAAVVLPARLASEGRAHGQCEGAVAGAGRDDGRLRAGGEGSRASRRGPAARHPAGRPLGVPLHTPAGRPRPAGAGASAGRRAGRVRGAAERRGRPLLRRRGNRLAGVTVL